MNTFALEIFEEQECCTFYTVRCIQDDDTYVPSETQQFFETFYADENYKQSIQEIVALLDYIGKERGAHKNLFRPERKAEALPKNEPRACRDLCLDFADFPLRLYCLRITDEILILFNGGIKDARTAQESKASMKFHEAQQFCERINQAFISKDIRIEGMKIIGENKLILL
ncbi:MAG: hypothetical protein WDZ45_02715 [Flavobacteriaceae bacterium]